ncbi:MAG: hypothetical protein RL669_808 [Pseudomonadota bacterium]|jgi:hypothetical protein
MKTYPCNSPQAVAHVVSIAMLVDASYHPKEVSALDHARAFERLGLSREEFLGIALDSFTTLMTSLRRPGPYGLLTGEEVDLVLDTVQDGAQRRLAFELVMELLPADGQVRPVELALVHRLQERWEIGSGLDGARRVLH